MSFILLGILNAQAAGAGGGADFELIERKTITSSTSSINFTSLDSVAADYKYLQMRWVAQTAVQAGQMRLTFNGSSSGYHTQTVYGDPNNELASYASGSYISLDNAASSNGDTVWTASGIFEFFDWADTSKTASIRGYYGQSASTDRMYHFAGLWDNTAAVTSFGITANQNYTYGQFALYGIRG